MTVNNSMINLIVDIIPMLIGASAFITFVIMLKRENAKERRVMKMQINKTHEKKIVEETLYLSQDDFIEHFNKKGKRMISCADTLNIDVQKEKDLIDSLREDFEKGFLVTSTQIDYKNNTITHAAKSTVVKPTTIKLNAIPTESDYLPKFLQQDNALDFLRALCSNMHLSKEKVIKKLEDISGMKKEKICIYVESDYNNYPIRAVLLYFGGGGFVVSCWGRPGNWYYWTVSRGVKR